MHFPLRTSLGRWFFNVGELVLSLSKNWTLPARLARMFEFGIREIRKSRACRFAASCLPVFLILFAPLARAQTPEPLPDDALKVLKLWVGTCETFIIGEDRVKGVATGILTLGGRFVRDDFEIKTTDGTVVLSGSTMITFDPKTNLYRMWSFLSSGDTSISEGKWDAEKRTLISTSRNEAKNETTIWTATFAADGSESWGFVTKDKDRNAVADVKGMNSARKKG